jgi:hypothetical protein
MDLQSYLESRGIKHRFFADKVGISTSTLHSFLKRGNMPSMRLAYEIEKETGGLVSLYDWLSDVINADHLKSLEKK